MAKVLLINSNRFKHPWPVIPFGLCWVATSLEITGNHNVRLLDLCFSTNCEEDIRHTIRDFVPDAIGISIRNIDDTGGYDVHFLLEDVKNEVIDPCKKEYSGPIVIGGPSVGISGREMLEYFDLEFAICGDGETVMLEFVDRIESRKPLEGLKGLIIRRDKSIIQDSAPYRVPDLNALLFPKPLRYLNLDNYRRFGSPIQIQTKRGCIFRCAYCTYNKIEGNQYRLINPGRIANEIETLVNETGINHIEFADSIFNVPLTHTKQVLREVIRKNLKLKLHTMGLTPAFIDEELIDLMKNAGFNEVDIGVESSSDSILESLNKEFKCSDIVNTANLLREKRMPATWFILLGAPEETRDSVIDTLNFMGRIASIWDLVFVSTGVRIYNGSPIAEQIIAQDEHHIGNNFLLPVKIEPNEIGLKEIYTIAKRFSYVFPNFYFYEKEHKTHGWKLICATFLLKIFHSRQPAWRLLILIRRIEWILAITFIKRMIYELKGHSGDKANRKGNGFYLIKKQKNASIIL